MSGSACGHRSLMRPETQGSRRGPLPARGGPPGGATPSYPRWAERPAVRPQHHRSGSRDWHPVLCTWKGLLLQLHPQAGQRSFRTLRPSYRVMWGRDAGSQRSSRGRGRGRCAILPPEGPRQPLVPLLRTVPVASANHEHARETRTLLRESLVCSHVARQTEKKQKTKNVVLIALQEWAGRRLVPDSLVGAQFSVFRFPFRSQGLPLIA